MSLVSEIGKLTLVVEEGAVLSIHPSINSILVSVQSSQIGVDGVDGEFGQGVSHGVGLHLADGLQAAGLLLDVHVVEGGVHQVNARDGIREEAHVRVSSGDALHSGQQEGKGGGGGEGDQGHDGCGQHEHVQLITVTQVDCGLPLLQGVGLGGGDEGQQGQGQGQLAGHRA